METNELMIGDWVLTQEGKPTQVYQIYNGIVATTDPSTTLYNVECFQPIKLTTEILEKNGFVHKTRWMQKGNFGYPPLILWHLLSSKILNRPEHLLEIHCGMKNIHISFVCEYVHQLQHALRLAGSDMNITL